MSDLGVEKVEGRAIAIHGNDIDTDRIIPARFLKAITFSELGKYPFNDERFDAHGNATDHPFNQEHNQGAKVLLVNSNFGCGSSREHAPQCLKRWGIDAVVGESFGEIFAGNCEMLGAPAVRASAEDMAKAQAATDADPSIEWTVDLDQMIMTGGNLRIPLQLAEGRRNALRQGHWDTTGMLVEHLDEARAVHARLPYTSNYE